MFLTRTRDSRTVLARNKRISGLAGGGLGQDWVKTGQGYVKTKPRQDQP